MNYGIRTRGPPPYSKPIEAIRQDEYPHMNSGTYLDHSGTTIYARSTVERFSNKMLSNLYGNPHSANEPAKISGNMVDEVRKKALRFLGADPRHFDLIFVANATAAIKLVADSFQDLAEQTRSGSFWYGYHRDAHTSLVGVRELTNGHHRCFTSDGEVEAWLDQNSSTAGGSDLGGGAAGRRGGRHPGASTGLGLFAYPGQSNLTGRRLPLAWVRKLCEARSLQNTYSLLDAAALAMTSSVAHVFADPGAAPDFTCVSFYKIFGFPDLGGLVVRKDSGHILALRKYFGGGTVSLVSTIDSAWHMSKASSSHALHNGLEDGTLPFHSILALGEAIDVHCELYGSMENISRHTSLLAQRLYRGIQGLRYAATGQPLCKVYSGGDTEGEEDEEGGEMRYDDTTRQGATVAFNLFREDGTYESYAEVERLANERGIYVRSGGVCNPGGVYSALQYEPWQLNRARSAGHHCGTNGLSVINELPTGVVRASLGAMSTTQDVDAFLAFLRETFLDKSGHRRQNSRHHHSQKRDDSFLEVDSLAESNRMLAAQNQNQQQQQQHQHQQQHQQQQQQQHQHQQQHQQQQQQQHPTARQAVAASAA
ncbi:pyridoxal phosphate-dependent transferase [Lasiosphaeria miniovina]|uniref:Pyridoxal phosphate-dependent transferase n=1 Tax=Lasiosphaeria miniovina TaxID=1954250 RepID=A0AA40BFY4_9PEZI|nr:pyridoxal phosphate-dependent transferase [Lasiosphaeria miniovina]KAK0733481.1 pyridoxal phosphate-dependent transferase [Lasiosphaeria miniovina]